MARAFTHTHLFTDEEEASIVERYVAGESAQALGAAFGLGSGKAIKRVLEERGAFVPGRRFTGQFSLSDRAAIVDRYRAGETQRAIAESYGCTGGNIRALLVRQNVFIRPMGNGPINPRAEKILRAMRTEGQPVETIAKHLGVPKYRVSKWIAELQLPRPSKVQRVIREGGVDGPRGYRSVYVGVDDPLREMASSNGFALEHRIFMARSIGRPLTRSETVHHINGDRADNRLANLQLRTGQHGQGAVFRCVDCGSHNVSPVPIAG